MFTASTAAATSGRPAKPTKKDQKDKRRKMFARLHIQWKELRPDLHFDPEGQKEALRDFAGQVLGIAVERLSAITTSQLGKVLDAIREEKSQPSLPGSVPGGLPGGIPGAARFQRASSQTPQSQGAPAEIVHLASKEQVWAINRVFEFLKWTPEGIAKFIRGRFRRDSATFLKPRDANDLLMIVLTIACSHELKRAHGAELKVSRDMIRAYMPKLKADLGIGLSRSEQEAQ